jgi:hypothetical protein
MSRPANQKIEAVAADGVALPAAVNRALRLDRLRPDESRDGSDLRIRAFLGLPSKVSAAAGARYNTLL